MSEVKSNHLDSLLRFISALPLSWNVASNDDEFLLAQKIIKDIENILMWTQNPGSCDDTSITKDEWTDAKVFVNSYIQSVRCARRLYMKGQKDSRQPLEFEYSSYWN